MDSARVAAKELQGATTQPVSPCHSPPDIFVLSPEPPAPLQPEEGRGSSAAALIVTAVPDFGTIDACASSPGKGGDISTQDLDTFLRGLKSKYGLEDLEPSHVSNAAARWHDDGYALSAAVAPSTQLQPSTSPSRHYRNPTFIASRAPTPVSLASTAAEEPVPLAGVTAQQQQHQQQQQQQANLPPPPLPVEPTAMALSPSPALPRTMTSEETDDEDAIDTLLRQEAAMAEACQLISELAEDVIGNNNSSAGSPCSLVVDQSTNIVAANSLQSSESGTIPAHVPDSSATLNWRELNHSLVAAGFPPVLPTPELELAYPSPGSSMLFEALSSLLREHARISAHMQVLSNSVHGAGRREAAAEHQFTSLARQKEAEVQKWKRLAHENATLAREHQKACTGAHAEGTAAVAEARSLAWRVEQLEHQLHSSVSAEINLERCQMVTHNSIYFLRLPPAFYSAEGRG